MEREYPVADIAEFLAAKLSGSPDVVITGLGTLERALPGQIAFIANSRHAKFLSNCQASAVIMSETYVDDFSGVCLICDDPYLSYAKLSRWFDRSSKQSSGIHASAVVASDAAIHNGVIVGPNAVIESGASISSGCRIGANTFIGPHVSLGKNCRIESNVSVYHDVKIGNHVTIHSGSVIGADGFGFAPNGEGGWEKIYQIGSVIIGDNVEIGACSTVDRGAIEDTIIGKGVILDNHVMIAHNVEIGDNTAMAAFAGIAGSAKIGKNCFFAGDAACLGHLRVADNVHITARSYVTKSINESGSYSNGGLPLLKTSKWRRNAVVFGKLNKLTRFLNDLDERN